MEEVWKDIYFTDLNGKIHDFRGRYQISNMVRIRSLNCSIQVMDNGTQCERKLYGRILKQAINPRGYFRIGLWKNGKRHDYFVHRIVAFVFLDYPKDLVENEEIACIHINHKDENKQNNNINNLEWVSAKENCNYGTRTERMKKNMTGQKRTTEQRKKMSMAQKRVSANRTKPNITSNKLTEEQVIEIRQRYENEEITQKELAKIYNVTPSVICNIVNRKTWTHI